MAAKHSLLRHPTAGEARVLRLYRTLSPALRTITGWLLGVASPGRDRSQGGPQILDYFNPSFLPAASRRIDSRMRLSRVSGRFAI